MMQTTPTSFADRMSAFGGSTMPPIALRMMLAMIFLLGFGSAGAESSRMDEYREWIEAMKSDPRGPFQRLRWFCNDGTVHPPNPYPCRERGGGHQHGELSDRAETLREEGYRIARLWAGVDAEDVVADSQFRDVLAQSLIERFLISADNGWILRRALFYRGAIQEEDEREGARAVLKRMAADPFWADQGYLAMRTALRLLPHGKETGSAQAIRQESAALSELDDGFMPIRAKIHGAPDDGDAARVRQYAEQATDGALQGRYRALADQIDAVYQARALSEELTAAAEKLAGASPGLDQALTRARADLADDDSVRSRFEVSAGLLGAVRSNLNAVADIEQRLAMLDLSLALEAAHLRAGTEIRDSVSSMTRRQRLQLLEAAGRATYGVGLVKPREAEALQASLERLEDDNPALSVYLEELRYLGRSPGWATQNLRFFFFEAMQKLAEIEPKSMLFIQDQLRGSPLLLFSNVLDDLIQDGNRLAGVEHRLFGETLGTGFNALNPGVAVGVLDAKVDLGELEDLDPSGIHVLPETVSDLPPIAGILTAGEGNPLSHVQLLARNLGIPNVAVDESLLPKLAPHDGERTILAVSAAGLVQMERFDDDWARRLGHAPTGGDVVIRPELEKLDLSVRHLVDLDDLRASDSGRTVGPKAAKLGELRSAFPESVAPGVAIPFGVFKAEVLDRPYRDGPGSVFDWMVSRYRELELLPPGSEQRQSRGETFRAELYDIIIGTQPSQRFREQLQKAMAETFGDQEVGVFVRSDTNVEDLPGFTGAGLNLTLPNVVGFEQVVGAISRVWASPFTARAFAWRQSHMENPEHVYTSVLLLGSVASEKSGVLVTQDLDTGDREVLSVAVNEGVGGAVDGQAAESLRIDTRDGGVRLMATATAPWQRQPAASGGIEKLPVRGGDRVLTAPEIERLIRFAREELPRKFPPIVDDDGHPAAADVEFGFKDGRLRLFQIRPFLESTSARGNALLIEMDRRLDSRMDRLVDLNEVP